MTLRDLPAFPGYIQCTAHPGHAGRSAAGWVCPECLFEGEARGAPQPGGLEAPQGTEQRLASAAPSSKPHARATAKRTACDCGRVHPSKLQARVCRRLRDSLKEGETLYHEVPMPLWSLAPDSRGKASTLRVDFVVVASNRMVRALDAKPRRWASREWRRGALAFEASYGMKVEEVS